MTRNLVHWARTQVFRSRRVGRGIVTAMSFLPGMLGCGPDASGNGTAPAFLQEDSAGVLLSITREPTRLPSIGWKVDSLPDLVIGAVDSPAGYLYRVQGVKGLDDGGLLVVNGGSQEIRFFDSQGHLIHRIGGRGEGPGEFVDPVLVPWLASDSLLLFDKGLPRLQVFPPGGGEASTVRLTRWPAGRRPPVGAVTSSSILFEGHGFYGGEVGAFRREGVSRRIYNFFWFHPSSGETPIVLDSIVVDQSYRDGPGVDAREWTIPFRSIPAAVVAHNGVFISDGHSPNIKEYDTEGRLQRILRLETPPRQVTSELMSRMLEIVTSDGSGISREEWESAYERMPIPEALPPFGTLRLDEEGWLWAELYSWDPAEPIEWVLFDRDGRARGTIKTPRRLEIEWIGRESLLGVFTDEMGIEYVHRHSLERGVGTVPGA